jgi:hypothetical protein
MIECLKDYFENKGKIFCKHLQNNVGAIMQCGQANTYSIARQLSKTNGKTFKANEMAIYRFLQDNDFQIDDSFWRCHVNLIFEALKANGLIKIGDKLQINVDFTTHEDNFLILSASILLEDKAITIYFTTRKYPKKKGEMSHKKMEEAFIKGLAHVLSKKYSYVIVADRGFGNQRFADLCKKNGFEYVLRINENLIIEVGGETKNLKERNNDEEFDGYVVAWKETHHFTIASNRDKTWYLLSNTPRDKARDYYEKRFKIEKNYQDCKSSGYDIEKNKIRKYDRFKRMMYLVVLAHALTCVIGYIIKVTSNCVKKNYTATDHLNIKLILAFLGLDMKPYTYIIRNACFSSNDYFLLN